MDASAPDRPGDPEGSTGQAAREGPGLPVAPLCSPWGEDLGDHPLGGYPRPMLERDPWVCLNGWWDHAVVPARGDLAAPLDDEPVPTTWDGPIRVPFALECAASGVMRALAPTEVLHYHRRVPLPEPWRGGRVVLRFEAVDHRCLVRVDGRVLARHEGGYLPFGVELPDTTRPEVDVVVTVRDPTDAGAQQRGKQALDPGTIWYTATSGIWQTVWMEALPRSAVTRVEATALPGLRGFEVGVQAEEPGALEVRLTDARGTTTAATGHSDHPLRVLLPHPRPWSTGDPHLYRLEVRCGPDRVVSWAALRTVALGHSDEGGAGRTRARFLLNGVETLLNTPLLQGYWPESGLTAPGDAAMEHDLRMMGRMGFNGVRVHTTIASRRFYHLADRLGMMVVQDMPAGGRTPLGLRASGGVQALDVTLPDRSKRFLALTGRSGEEDRRAFTEELEGMVRLLGVHGCVVMWVPFNEGWGQFDARGAAALLHRIDPTRLVDHASGWFDQGVGDVRSRHRYVLRLRRPPLRDRRPFSLSEFGGLNLAVQGHRWSQGLPFGYRFLADREALAQALADLWRTQLLPLTRHGLAACTYTQVSDVETEENGLMTYDRRVTKVDPGFMARLNGELDAAFAAAPALARWHWLRRMRVGRRRVGPGPAPAEEAR